MRGASLLFLVLAFCLPRELDAQTAPATYWVHFRDKANTPYSLSGPSAYLSERAIARRQRQQIPVDSLDLPVDPAYIASLLSAGEFELLLVSKWFNAVTIRTTDTLALDSLGLLPFVAEVRNTRDGRERPLGTDKNEGRAKLFESEYGMAFRQVSMMNGHLLQNLGEARGEGMLIGILDSGFEGVDHYPGFASLREQDGIAFTKDFVEPGGNVFLVHNHGRMVLSMMAAEVPGRLGGTAPNARYALARTEDANSEYLVEEDNWVSGAEWCDSLGCDVLNTSLGYTTFDDPAQDHSYADMDGNTTRISIAARIASERGMIPVNSAGNSGAAAWHFISAPADAEGILTVGAVDNDRRVADFSSRGPTADGRLKPDVSAVGEGTVGLGWDPFNPASGNGTSFSSPLVAGLTACLWQLHPEASNTAIMDAVRRSSSHYNAPNDSIGYGVPDYWRAHLLLGGRDLTGLSTDQVLNATPVPFTHWMDVEVYAGTSGTVELQLFDAAGRIVWHGTYSVEPGTFNRVRVEGDLARLRAGVYVLDARIGAHRSTFRVVKAG